MSYNAVKVSRNGIRVYPFDSVDLQVNVGTAYRTMPMIVWPRSGDIHIW